MPLSFSASYYVDNLQETRGEELVENTIRVHEERTIVLRPNNGNKRTDGQFMPLGGIGLSINVQDFEFIQKLVGFGKPVKVTVEFE